MRIPANLRQRLLSALGIALLTAASLAIGGHAAPPAPSFVPDWTAAHVGDELLMRLPDSGAAAVQAQLARAGMTVIRRIPQLDLVLVRAADASGDAALAAASAEALDAGALWVEPNYLIAPFGVPNDPDYAIKQAPYLSRLEMPAAWDVTTGRPEIVVAVLDTGVNLSHPEFAGAIWTNPGEIPGNGVDDEGNGFIDDVHGWDFAEDDNLPDDDHGHGTHVAGIIGARIGNGIGMAGMAGAATLMPVDVFRYSIGTYADLIEAILYATDNGAHVINMSLGATSYSRGEEAAVDYAWTHGAIPVAAAGNTRSNTYHYPAAHPHAIAVAATDWFDNRASFSTWGDFVDVAAPGVAIWSTYRDGYATLQGTSMASPHVAGLAALILSADPTLTAEQVRARIEATADDLGAAGFDPYFGHGRINARRALEGLPVNPVPVPPPTPAPHQVWPAGCREIITGGAFEQENAAWQTAGSVSRQVITGPAGTATWAMRFAGGPATHGALAQMVAIPENMRAATLSFFYRIESLDGGSGSTPQAPWDDSLIVEWRRPDDTPVLSLLRTGNTADNSGSGLAWDDYLYVLSADDVALLRAQGTLKLSFEARNDDDSLPTTFWVDDVRLCAAGPSLFLPLIAR